LEAKMSGKGNRMYGSFNLKSTSKIIFIATETQKHKISPKTFTGY